MRAPILRFLIVPLVVAAPGVAPVRAQRAEPVEMRGNVVSARTGEPVAGAWIALEGRGFGTYSWRDGHFRLPEVPPGPRRYEVEALGYFPSTPTLDPSTADLVLALEPDDSLQAGLSRVFDRLDRRRRGGRVFDKQTLAFSGAFDLQELLRMRGVRGVGRFCLDERWVPGLSSAPPQEYYMLEIHGGTARLYTEEFLAEMAAADTETLQRVIRVESPAC
jgi:hypothetical protein